MNATNPARQTLNIIGAALVAVGAIAILIGFLTGASFTMGASSLGAFMDLALAGTLNGPISDNSFSNVLVLAGGMCVTLGGVALLLALAVRAIGLAIAMAPGLTSVAPAALLPQQWGAQQWGAPAQQWGAQQRGAQQGGAQQGWANIPAQLPWGTPVQPGATVPMSGPPSASATAVTQAPAHVPPAPPAPPV